MARKTAVTAHPRLYISPEAIARVNESSGLEFLEACANVVEERAKTFRKDADFQTLNAGHNAHLIRARNMQTRIVTLLVQWMRTGEESFRRSAIDHVYTMGAWEYWSWITWRESNADYDAIFDLSYGENSTTLAIAYDLLYDTLTADERKAFQKIALERSFKPFLKQTAPKAEMWWFGRRYSNWNTVCAGGGGMLALAMYDDLKEARQALPRAEKSFEPYFEGLRETGGGWPEGIGYWNYGMRYAFMYLLSHERATGVKHPLMKHSSVKNTLSFPLDFCPNGKACGFGDANGFSPMGFHYAVADRLGAADVIASLDHQITSGKVEPSPRPKKGELPRPVDRVKGASWPTHAEMLLLHPRPAGKAGRVKPAKKYLSFYEGQDWGVIADQMPDSNLYVSVRGGTTDVPHTHLDLTSFYLVLGDEMMVEDIGTGEYLDTTFSPRRFYIPEFTSLTKNVLLVNGVGISHPTTVKTAVVQKGKLRGFRFDAAEALGADRGRGAVTSYERLILSLDDDAILLVDRLVMPHVGRIEQRLHTRQDMTPQKAGFKVKGKTQRLTIASASTAPASTHTAVHAMSSPYNKPGPNVMRWVSDKLEKDLVMASLLVPGGSPAKVVIEQVGKQITIACSGKSFSQKITMSDHLNVK